MWIYSPYITKNGVRIYPRNGKKVFRFWVDDAAATENKAADEKSAMHNTSSDEEE